MKQKRVRLGFRYGSACGNGDRHVDDSKTEGIAFLDTPHPVLSATVDVDPVVGCRGHHVSGRTTGGHAKEHLRHLFTGVHTVPETRFLCHEKRSPRVQHPS
jgi:hypothetical protein